MIPSSSRFSFLRFSWPLTDASVPSTFSGLIANQDTDRVYLLHATPYDPVGAAEVDVRFSVGLKNTILGGYAWPARLDNALNAEVSLFGKSDILTGQGTSAFGIIRILIGDGLNDDMLAYEWDGRSITLLMGAQGFDLSEFQPVFIGTAQDIEFDDSYMSIVLRDKAELLRKPAQQAVYAGTGGLEGGSNLAGVRKPLAFGKVRNIEPVLVDRANLVYQWHHESVEAVAAVYDGALALTFAGDVADITATTVSAGSYKTQLSGGYIKLGAEPSKRCTLDGSGDNSGGSYVSTAADIIEHLIADHSVLSAAELNLASFAACNVANSSELGWYGADINVSDLISQLMFSIGGSWVFDRIGQLTLDIFDITTAVGHIDETDIVSIKRKRAQLPTWKRQLAYQRAWTVQQQDEVLAGATDAMKDFVSHQYRYATDEDATILDRRKLAGEIVLDTLLESATAAATEAARQQAIFGADTDPYDVIAKRQQFKYRAGQTITVNYGRFGFPKDMVILGVVENTRDRLTTLRLFG